MCSGCTSVRPCWLSRVHMAMICILHHVLPQLLLLPQSYKVSFICSVLQMTIDMLSFDRMEAIWWSSAPYKSTGNKVTCFLVGSLCSATLISQTNDSTQRHGNIFTRILIHTVPASYSDTSREARQIQYSQGDPCCRTTSHRRALLSERCASSMFPALEFTKLNL